MNFIKKGIAALSIAALIFSCQEDDKPNPKGLSEIVFSGFSAEASGDGTLITVTPVSIGATSYSVDFGDPNSTEDVLTIAEHGGSVSYDYPNEEPEVEYVISVTAQSNAGLSSVTKTDTILVSHSVPSGLISSAPSSPSGRRYEVFSIYTDGMEYDGAYMGYPVGSAGTGGTVVALESGNSILEFSRLGSNSGTVTLADAVVTADAFATGVAATSIHFDIYSIFTSGVDKLKITLMNGGDEYVIDDVELTDGAWASFDFDLASDFSGSVMGIEAIKLDVGSTGTANDHATIGIDNIYLTRPANSSIVNGDFDLGQDFWKWGVFTNGDTNPYGSSSDGSDFDIDGNDTGGKTKGAKWSSSQSGGEWKSASSRYAYQELNLTPGEDYVLEYQYAIKDDEGTDPVGGRSVVGLVLGEHFIDGADAVSNISSNIGLHNGQIAEGKFSDTPDDYGTFVQIPFTATSNGQVAVMFYAVTPVDAYIDNVKVVEASAVTAPEAAFSAEQGVEELEFVFTNTSKNAASFEWDFGDGQTSTEKSPSHSYANGGNYDVVLTAKNSSGSVTSTESITVTGGAIQATFKAVVLNGTGDDLTIKTSDNADAFDMTPPSTIYDDPDTQASPYTWSNSALDGWLKDNCGDDSEQPSSTSDGNKFAQLGDRGYKLNESCRRLYQPVTVEVGVEYTFTIDSRSEASGVNTEVYILNTAIADEVGIIANGKDDASVDAFFLIDNDFNATKSSTTDDTFTTNTFKFIPSTTEIIIYVRAPGAVDSSNEVFYDNIDIITPGF